MGVAPFIAWTTLVEDGSALPSRGGGSAPPKAEAPEDPAFSIEAVYVADLWRAASGGLRKGTRYLDDIEIAADADLEKLAGIKGVRAHASAIRENGKSISALTGDAQFASSIESGLRTARLFEAWLDTRFGKKASLRGGLLDVNAEFDVLETGNLFIASPNAIGTDLALSGRNGPSIFPSTSLGARLEVAPKPGWKLRASVLDGVPGNPARPGRTSIKLGNGDGALVIGEVEAPVARGKLLMGHWRYTAPQLAHAGPDRRDRGGYYLRGETNLAQSRAEPARKLDAFFRLSAADGRINAFNRFANAGLTLAGAFPGRPDDRMGIAVAHARTSRSWRLNNGGGKSETNFEATYRAELTKNVALQPFAQYIASPGANRRTRNAFAFGMRAEISLRFSV